MMYGTATSKVVLEHQLVNPDFKGEIDYAAKVVVDEDGHRKVCDLMSGQWAFEQSISEFFLVAAQVTNFEPDPRTSSQRMLTHTVQCLCQLFLVVTRLQYQLRRVIRSTTPFTSCLGTYIIMSAVSQSVDLGQNNNPNTTPTKDYKNVRVVVYLRGVQR